VLESTYLLSVDAMKTSKIKRAELTLLIIAILQIFLLINLAIADSYIISQADSLNGNSKKIGGKNKIKNLINFGLNLLIGFLSIKQIGIVSAQELNIGEWCCSETNAGAKCQAIPSIANELSCPEGNVIQTNCASASICQIGTCVYDTGLECSSESPKNLCEGEGGVFSPDSLREIPERQKGCCITGSNANLETERQCKFRSFELGIEMDFRPV